MARYAAYKIRTSCTHCGNPLILNGPKREPECPSCLNRVEIEPGTWSGLLGDIVQEYDSLGEGQGSQSTVMTGGFTFKLEYYRAVPDCPRCGETLDADSVPDGADSKIVCSGCSTTMDSFPAPAWLREVLPQAIQVFGADREQGDQPDAALDEAAAAIKPVVLSCPQCSGSLKITSGSERIVPCSYCDVDVYLPDAIWLKLHPVKVMSHWYIRLKGS